MSDEVVVSVPKKRHGCLTAWLVLMVICNVFAIVMAFGSNAILIAMGHPEKANPAWVAPVLAVDGILQIVCVVGLFQWKKWGFYGIAALAVVNAVVNSILGHVVLGIFGAVVGVALLYAVLQIGSEDKGWPQLD